MCQNGNTKKIIRHIKREVFHSVQCCLSPFHPTVEQKQNKVWKQTGELTLPFQFASDGWHLRTALGDFHCHQTPAATRTWRGIPSQLILTIIHGQQKHARAVALKTAECIVLQAFKEKQEHRPVQTHAESAKHISHHQHLQWHETQILPTTEGVGAGFACKQIETKFEKVQLSWWAKSLPSFSLTRNVQISRKYGGWVGWGCQHHFFQTMIARHTPKVRKGFERHNNKSNRAFSHLKKLVRRNFKQMTDNLQINFLPPSGLKRRGTRWK